MKKEFFFDRYCGQQFVAVLEDGKLTEFETESESGKSLVGNVYKGRVMNILSGMNAAFISCGLDKNCYLSMDETYTDFSKYDGAPFVPKSVNLHEGDEVIVQVTKPPRGNKGAKVTTHLSFVGKRLIFLPDSDFLGISRKITDLDVREKLLAEAEKMRKKWEGFVVRTQAPFATKKALKSEAEYLKGLHRVMLDHAENAQVGDLLYSDYDLPVRAMRDSMGDDTATMFVGDRELYNRLVSLAKLRGDFPVKKIVRYDGERSMMHVYGIDDLVLQAISPNVALDGGGYLVIDHTEAMTVIDVNTGSYVGDTSLEDTVFHVNLEAAKEIARQVRLRNIGGIVVVDFIDMADPEHRDAVTARLNEYLSVDKAKCHLLPMSEFCLSEFTRKRVGDEVSTFITKTCTSCQGRGYIPAEILTVSRIRSDILDKFSDGYKAVVVELNDSIMKKIVREGFMARELFEKWRKNTVYMIPHKTYEETQYYLKGDNSGVLDLPDKAQLLY